ncbi:MAG: hypothetical protein K0R33_1732 [Mycobacterium sp.]|nr:hypothetical protein [Mycobacterium sp.]
MPDETTPEDDAVREDFASEDEADQANGSKHAAPEAATGDDAEQPEGSGRSPAVIAVIAMLVAIGTLGVSAYMWRNPLTPIDAPTAAPTAAPEPTFTDAQREEAKAKVCDAFLVVSTGVANSSGMQAADGDAIGAIAIATNARLALYGGGQYMLNRVDAATEPQLAEAARAFGNALMDVGAAAVANIPSDDPAHQERVKDADEENAKLQGICNPQ